jgi:hypothetical protein
MGDNSATTAADRGGDHGRGVLFTIETRAVSGVSVAPAGGALANHASQAARASRAAEAHASKGSSNRRTSDKPDVNMAPMLAAALASRFRHGHRS